MAIGRGQSQFSTNTPKQLLGHGGQQSVNTSIMTPEEKSLMRERRRVESLVRTYSSRPNQFDEAYVLQLEQMAHQYGIPFQRASAGFLPNAGAAVGGFIDSFLWDMIPDDWYSSQATATARKMGKGAGLASAAILSGGTSLLGRGMTKFAQTGVGRFTTAGAALGAKKMLAPTVAAKAGEPGIIGNIASKYAASGQGQNVATLAVDDIATQASKLVKKGNKKAAINRIEGAGDLLDDAGKLKMAQHTGAVKGKLESDIYAATKGIGKAATTAVAKPGSVEAIEQMLLQSLNKKGVGPATKKAVESFMKDRNKVDQLAKILNDPKTDLDMAVKLIQDIVPKNIRPIAASRSDIIQTLTSFYGFGNIGG